MGRLNKTVTLLSSQLTMFCILLSPVTDHSISDDWLLKQLEWRSFYHVNDMLAFEKVYRNNVLIKSLVGKDINMRLSF